MTSELFNMRRDVTLLAVSLLLLVVMSAFLALGSASYVRTLVALPLIFVVPGLVMLRAVRVELTASGRQVHIVGLSMAVTVLGGLLLALGSWLTTWGWLLWFGVVTLGGALFTLGRGSAAPIRWHFPRIRVRHFALCGAIVGVVVLTLQNGTRNHDAYLPFRYTDFWMLPDGQGSNLYTIGVKNGERIDEHFTVRVMVDGAIVGAWQVLVPADQTITHTLALPPGQKAVAWLLRGKDPGEVYRSVSASLHGTAWARNY
jgi:hypothetical protein